MMRTRKPEASINPLRLGLAATAAGLLFLCACQSPFAHSGPKFDGRVAHAITVTNLTAMAVTNQVHSDLLQPASQPFTLGPGDKIDLELLSDPTTRTTVTVGPDGKIYFYLLPGTDVWGLTLGQTKALLERELGEYEAGAQVVITLRSIESRHVWLLGRLRNPGIYSVGMPMTLLEAISMAGGLLSASGPGVVGNQELADLHRAFVIRDGQLVPVDFERLIKQGDMTQNVYLHPDDFVYIPSAVSRDVYVLGAVHLPKPVSYEQCPTLIAAISDVGGTIKDAYLSHVAIVRGSVSQPRIAVVNYKDIIAGRASDVRLEPRDIVYVPFTPYKTLVKYVDLIVTTFVRAEALNEGARAVSQNAPPIGITVGGGGIR
jgi:protein involved in polysaccharide export with SLBB domain